MADFYAKYGSKNAKLVCNIKLVSTSIKVHEIDSKFIVSKNRKILKKTIDLSYALKYASELLQFEVSDLFINFLNY